jgi:hypothetical protein
MLVLNLIARKRPHAMSLIPANNAASAHGMSNNRPKRTTFPRVKRTGSERVEAVVL